MDDKTQLSSRTRTAAPTGGARAKRAEQFSPRHDLAAAGDQPPSAAARWLMRIVMFVTPVLLLALLAGFGAYVRLSHGPISLKSLSGPIERGISAELGDLQAKVDDTVLRFSETGGIEFRLINLRLLDNDGSTVASAPVAAVELSGASFTSLRLVPRRVELIEPRLSLNYSEATGFTLRFQDNSEAIETLQATDSPPPLLPVKPGSPDGAGGDGPVNGAAPFKQIDLARALAQYTARARQGLDASASLEQIGLRNATLALDYAGQNLQWKVPEVAIDLDHARRRSVIAGSATIESDRGPWALSFRTEDSDKTNKISLKASVRDLVPSSLGRAIPELSLLKLLDMPIAGDSSIELSTEGDLTTAALAIEFGRGLIDGPAVTSETKVPVLLDAGLMHLTYDAASEHLTLSPSTFKWGGTQMTLIGAMRRAEPGNSQSDWRYSIESTDGVLVAEEFANVTAKLDMFKASGSIGAGGQRVVLDEGKVTAAGATAAFRGEVRGGDDTVSGMRLEGAASPASLDAVKLLWPRMITSPARTWIGEHVTTGTAENFSLKFDTGVFAANQPPRPDGKRERFLLTVEGRDVTGKPLTQAPPVSVPHALVKVENGDLDITVPDAVILASEKDRVPLKGGRFVATRLSDPVTEAVVTFRAIAPLEPVVQTIKASPLLANDVKLDFPAESFDGKFDGQFKASFPLAPHVPRTSVKVESKARITDIKSRKKSGLVQVQSGAIDLEVQDQQATAKGELILNGVLAKLNWRKGFDEAVPALPQPVLTARLDNSDRRQLGIDINDYVQGEVPVEIMFADGVGGAPVTKVKADLTQAELIIDELAWKKPAGRPATLTFDIASGKAQKTELQNFKISGDTIAIEGWIALSPDNKVTDFYFPEFSMNVVSRLEIQGARNSKNVWDVKAKGTTFDGKDFFRSLFSLSDSGASSKSAKSQSALNLSAEIGNVLGHSDVSMRGLKLKMSRSADQLTALDARGTLDGGEPAAAELQVGRDGKRRIFADSTDAGQALRMIGFYPNIQGGRVRVEVDLDGKGPAEKTGVLWVDQFKILGDPVVAEVVSGVDAGGSPAISAGNPGSRKVIREVLEFDRMKVPFSVGYGQFVIEDSFINGPVLGATMRGRLDYGAQRVNLGGTYVPLQGLNNALGGIPVLGQILSGPRGEGIFGITFAIQGPMANPQVVVNPLSMVAPGIFREIFQMTNPDPKVQARLPKATAVPVEQRVRASGSDVSGGAPQRGDKASAGEAPTIDGWSTTTVVPSSPGGN